VNSTIYAERRSRRVDPVYPEGFAPTARSLPGIALTSAGLRGMAGCASLCLPARSALTVPPPYLLAWLLPYFQSLAHSLSPLFRPDLLFSAAYGLFCKYRGWGSSVNSISTSLSFVIRLFSSSLQPQTSIFQQLAASCPSLCSDFTPRFLYFQQLTDTFLQTRGVGANYG
jgi:hypothetical protein